MDRKSVTDAYPRGFLSNPIRSQSILLEQEGTEEMEVWCLEPQTARAQLQRQEIGNMRRIIRGLRQNGGPTAWRVAHDIEVLLARVLP